MTDFFHEATSGQVPISASSSGDNTILSMFTYLSARFPNADADKLVNKRIFVTHYHLVAHGQVTMKWYSGTTQLSGGLLSPVSGWAMSVSANDPCVFFTEKNNDIILNLSSAVEVGGIMSFYIK